MKHRRLPRNIKDWSDRFESLVVRLASQACWPWCGRRNKYGRGIFDCTNKQKGLLAPRLVWLLTTGKDPGRWNVLHKCDHPWCCNPAHLWLGTQRANVIDMIQKGRKWIASGEKHGRAKLSEAKVRAIRRSKKTNVALAAKYDVSDLLISMVKRRLIWKLVA